MLVCGSLVAVDGDALIHLVAVTVESLAQGLHHQLLEVAAEHLEAIAIGKHHHVATSFAVPGNEP